MDLTESHALARVDAIRAGSGRAWLTGAVFGIGGGFVAVPVLVVGGACCVGPLLLPLVPAAAGLFAGPIAASAPVYGGLSAGDGLVVGAGLGMRGGASAAVASVLGPVVMIAIGLGVWAVASPSADVGAAIAIVGVWSAAFVGGGILLGAVLGAAGGAVIGELRQPVVSPSGIRARREAPPAEPAPPGPSPTPAPASPGSSPPPGS